MDSLEEGQYPTPDKDDHKAYLENKKMGPYAFFSPTPYTRHLNKAMYVGGFLVAVYFGIIKISFPAFH